MADDFKNIEYDLTNTMRITKAKEDGFRTNTDTSTHFVEVEVLKVEGGYPIMMF